MDNKKKEEIINEMNKVINYYVENHMLFAGGCCYAAYVLARYLTKLGISYNTCIFQYGACLYERNFKKVINGEDVSHVAIEVKVGGNKMFIGDCIDIYKYFQSTGFEYKVRHYHHIHPSDILHGYRNNCWNRLYDTNNNTPLSKAIKMIYQKYAEEI